MASKAFYQRFFEEAEKKLNPQVALESPFGNLGASCSECDSSRVKILFEAKGLDGISVFLHCQDCRHRESI
jgi:hypothetical protein